MCLCPVLSIIPLDLVKTNGVISKKSAVVRYIRDALTMDVDKEDQPRVATDMLTREVLYRKDGDNCVINNAAIMSITSSLISPLGSDWDYRVISEIKRACSAGILVGAAAVAGSGDSSNLAAYYASLASCISEEAEHTVEKETHQPVYNEDLVREIDVVRVGQDEGQDTTTFASVSREASDDNRGHKSG